MLPFMKMECDHQMINVLDGSRIRLIKPFFKKKNCHHNCTYICNAIFVKWIKMDAWKICNIKGIIQLRCQWPTSYSYICVAVYPKNLDIFIIQQIVPGVSDENTPAVSPASSYNRIKRVAPCRYRTCTLKNPAKCLWRWEADRRYNFFFSPPARLCSHIRRAFGK